jgi:hypothetical protein
MKCPHCLVEFFENNEQIFLGEDRTSQWFLDRYLCHSCLKYILGLTEKCDGYTVNGKKFYHGSRNFLCYPRAISRSPLSPDVPEQFASDYREACITLADSPKASAALSRRCLQNLLREASKVKPCDLYSEIEQVIKSCSLPSTLSESLDAVRNIGNFAAHPIKSKSSGEIIDVENGEAEWNLDVLESLFDFYFVQPALIRRKKEALNQKLKDAGKPEMK